MYLQFLFKCFSSTFTTYLLSLSLPLSLSVCPQTDFYFNFIKMSQRLHSTIRSYMCQLKSILKSFKLIFLKTLSLHNVQVKQTNSLRNVFLFFISQFVVQFCQLCIRILILLHKLQHFDIDVNLVLMHWLMRSL